MLLYARAARDRLYPLLFYSLYPRTRRDEIPTGHSHTHIHTFTTLFKLLSNITADVSTEGANQKITVLGVF